MYIRQKYEQTDRQTDSSFAHSAQCPNFHAMSIITMSADDFIWSLSLKTSSVQNPFKITDAVQITLPYIGLSPSTVFAHCSIRVMFSAVDVGSSYSMCSWAWDGRCRRYVSRLSVRLYVRAYARACWQRQLAVAFCSFYQFQRIFAFSITYLNVLNVDFLLLVCHFIATDICYATFSVL